MMIAPQAPLDDDSRGMRERRLTQIARPVLVAESVTVAVHASQGQWPVALALTAAGAMAPMCLARRASDIRGRVVQALIDSGCAQGQGYLFGNPQPAVEFERLLQLAPDSAERGQREQHGAFLPTGACTLN